MLPVLTLLLALTGVLAPRTIVADEVPRGPVAPPTAPDATADRIAVFVEHSGRDVVGRAFVDSLRTSLRASTRLRLSDEETDAGILVIVVSASPLTDGAASAVSLAYVANNEWRSLLGSAARYVGKAQAPAMGRATVDELIAVLTVYDPTAAQ